MVSANVYFAVTRTGTAMVKHTDRAIDTLGGNPESVSFCLEDVGDESLGVSIDYRKPGALVLGHDAVTLVERVIVRRKWCWQKVLISH
jgi:hypothetical protein